MRHRAFLGGRRGSGVPSDISLGRNRPWVPPEAGVGLPTPETQGGATVDPVLGKRCLFIIVSGLPPPGDSAKLCRALGWARRTHFQAPDSGVNEQTRHPSGAVQSRRRETCVRMEEEDAGCRMGEACWSMRACWGTLGACWGILGHTGECWGMLGHHGGMLGHDGTHWGMQGHAGACWGTQGDSGACWGMLGKEGGCWGSLGHMGYPGAHWGTLGHAGACWGMMGHAGGCWGTWGNAGACWGTQGHAGGSGTCGQQERGQEHGVRGLAQGGQSEPLGRWADP